MKLALIIVCFVATGAVAQPAKPDPGEAAYQEGRRFYDLREWDEAIVKFKEAYKLRSDEPSLFNIAQSYRLKGDCGEALGFYKTYKRNFPTAQNIAAVDKFIADLEPCAKQQQERGANTEPEHPNTEPDHSKPRPVYEDRGASKRSTGLIVGGAGVLLAGTGVAFGLLAQARANAVTNGDGMHMWDPNIEASGKRFDTLAKVMWGTGGAAIIAGTVLYVMGKTTEHVRVSVAPASGGAMFVWQTAF